MITPEKCLTCGGSKEVGHTVALPGHALATTITRYVPCTDCTSGNVELQGDALDAEIIRLGGAENPEYVETS